MNLRRSRSAFFNLTAIAAVTAAFAADIPPRRVLSLDGVWQIAEGNMEPAPTLAAFARTVPVPGLVTLATPAFDPPPGPKVADRHDPGAANVDPARAAFWYRRTFTLDGPVPAVARLKMHKAMFGSRVILNGQVLGDHAPNATPGWFDARAALRTGENELLVRIGASRAAVPKGVPNLHDDEKDRYLPGIFDSVELILSGTPHFLHVQTAPDINHGVVRVQAVLRNDGPTTQTPVEFVVREAKSGRIAGRGTRPPTDFATGTETTVDVTVPIADCRLWSPEDPFLYRLEADSGGDRFTTRFGMREFKFDPQTRQALLNGKPYFMRGSNITLYRFFEDPACGDLPWRADWVRRLHERVKDMHWNSLRYSIGFPPEAWYDIADELGILIQDEFPVWRIGGTERNELAHEYTQWMRERWNHPSVVIWDAQNETRSPITGEALNLVRALDLSGRPWDNGYGEPQAATDAFESHPYHFSHPGIILADLSRLSPWPRGGPVPYDRKHAAIVNEFGWLWLNRDGTPTTLTAKLYRNLVGENATAATHRHLYALLLAADTEFWRHGRRAAAVMHFATLGYSRPDGQTSDHWTDVPELKWEPEFHRHVRDAFAPVSPMIDHWTGAGIVGQPIGLAVRLLNDLEQPWSGPVTLRLRRTDGGPALYEQTQTARLDPHGQGRVDFALTWPAAGDCVLDAELTGADGQPVHSVREIQVNDAASLGLAFGRPAFASSHWSPPPETEDDTRAWVLRAGPAANAVDGDPSTYWASAAGSPSWLAVDLGAARRISRMHVFWGAEYALAFKAEVSPDAQTWTEVAAVAANATTRSELRFTPVHARYVRVVGLALQPAAPRGWPPAHEHYAIRELQVFE